MIGAKQVVAVENFRNANCWDGAGGIAHTAIELPTDGRRLWIYAPKRSATKATGRLLHNRVAQVTEICPADCGGLGVGFDSDERRLLAL